jgi:hypothetical protein
MLWKTILSSSVYCWKLKIECLLYLDTLQTNSKKDNITIQLRCLKNVPGNNSNLEETNGRYGSSNSIMPDYRLEDQGSIACRGREFILCPLCPGQFWSPSSLLYNGYRGFFHGGKTRPGRNADHSPHLVPSSVTSRSYTSSPPWHLHGDTGTAKFVGNRSDIYNEECILNNYIPVQLLFMSDTVY